MDPEMRELLEKNLALSEDNNRILRQLRRAQRFSLLWKIFYLLVFLGGAAYAYTYLRPYYEGVVTTYASIRNAENQVKSKVFNFETLFGGKSGTSTEK
jgi:Sec-independent protein secretion pathway component TatC